MTESFHESAAHERDRSLDGLIEVAYNDAHSIVLNKADVVPQSLYKEGVNIPYEALVTRDGYILEPYTLYDQDGLIDFGSGLDFVELLNGKTALQSKNHTYNLGFLSLIQTINKDDIEIIRTNNYRDYRDDSIKYAMLHRELKDQKHDLWLRLQQKQYVRGVTAEPIVARLEYIGFNGDSITMIPHIKNTDGHRVDYIPEQLTLGDPWLYVGVDYRQEPDEE